MIHNSLFKNKGQTLLEILIVSVIIGIVVASIAFLVNTGIDVQKRVKKAETAAKLLKETQDAAKSMAEKNWFYYISTTTSGIHYKIASTTAGWVLQEGEETVLKNNMTFTRYVVFGDVYRNFSYPDFQDDIVALGGLLDPSTKKLTVYVTSTENFILSASEYLTRYWNAVWTDTDWSGGSTTLATATAPLDTFATSTNINYATSGEIKISGITEGGGEDIDSGIYNHWAWSDEIGWIDFTPGVVKVTSTKLMYYASSSIGEISLDCATSPSSTPNICSVSNYFVSNDGEGDLAGWAWNDNIGWISFCGKSGSGSFWDSASSTWKCPTGYSFRVTIDTVGDFHGWAWSDEIGWFSFNCLEPAVCGTSQYKVKTNWGINSGATGTLMSHIYDLGTEENATSVVLNSVTWKGDGCSASGCKVWLKIASATSSTAGPWEDIDFKGYDGTSATWYGGTNLTSGAQTKQIKIRRIDFNNKRYFRYKIMIEASADGTQSPVVRDVIFNWSR